MNDKLVHLHGHGSHGSLLDGLTKTTELVDYTLELGQPASCLTDHGTLASVIDHYQYAKKMGQKPIIGFEAYVTKDHLIKDKTEAQAETENKREHLVLLAQNHDAYKRLNKICSIGCTEGFYYRPRIDDKVLEDIGTKGIIGMSACLAGRVAQRIIKDDIEGAEKWAIYYYKLFNNEFYLEIQPLMDPIQVKVNLGLIEIYKKTGIPIVATSDFHYLKKEDSESHDVLLAMQSRSLMSDPNRWRFPGDTFYVMTRNEMKNAFNSNGHEILDQNIVDLAMDTTVEVAEKCNVELDLGKHYLPIVKPPQDDEKFNEWAEKRLTDETISDKFLRYLSIKGLKERNKTTKEYRERLDEELAVIAKAGFSDYFLIMWDIMRYAREEKIPYGPGRGSSCGSLVSFSVRITKVDPLQYNLMFARFLNEKRLAIPDIDSDLDIKNGHKVFSYLMEKYGKEYCCNIVTFGRLQLKAVIKDLAKTFSVPFEEVNDLTRSIPEDIKHINELYESFPQARLFLDKYPQILQHAKKLEGSPRHVSQHPAGVCVSPIPITDLIAVQNAKDTTDGSEPLYLSQFEKEQVRLAGLVKIDLLRLKNVTEIQFQIDSINKLYPELVKEKFNGELTDETIPFDDEKTWDLICSGNLLGIFQFSSHVAAPVIKKVQPRNIEELSAANSFIRPGASGVDEYVSAKSNIKNIRKLDPRLDKHLDPTYGAIVYQEQIMALIAELMGISFGEADLYRRALEKPDKDKADLVQNFNNNVVENATKLGFNPEVADLVRKLIIDNIGYSFNKSHAVAYAIIAYWTAYLKVNFPVIFYTMMFNGNIDELGTFMASAKKGGITIKPPHVNYSKYETTIEDLEGKVIRIGLNAIKGIGDKAATSIVGSQPFTSIDDFFTRNDLRRVNKGVIEALLNVNAMGELGIEIENSDIPTQFIHHFDIQNKIINGTSKEYIYLNREQIVCWYNKYNEILNMKNPPNYEIPVELIKGKYRDIYEMIEEKFGTIVIPESRLKDLEIELTSAQIVEYRSRKKPKGEFEIIKEDNKTSPFRKVFSRHYNNLLKVNLNYLDIYLRESKELGYSFLEHPLEDKMDRINIFNDTDDGKELVIAGIITEVVSKKSRNNKKYYHVIVKTPRENVKLIMWDNGESGYVKNKDIIKINKIILARGTKGYGGITVENVKLLK